MAWTWRYDTTAGPSEGSGEDQVPTPAQASFPSQADAESWLGESWRELLSSGVTRVTLMDDAREVYPMGLKPA